MNDKILLFNETFKLGNKYLPQYEIEKILQLNDGKFLCIHWKERDEFLILEKDFNIITKVKVDDEIYYITQLKSGELIIVINLYILIYNEKTYELIYKIYEEKRDRGGTEILIELSNLTLVSCAYGAGYSGAYPIIFYEKKSNSENKIEYEYSYSNYDLIGIFCITEMKNNIIAVLMSFNYKVQDNYLFFFDYNQKKYLDNELGIDLELFTRNSLVVINDKFLGASGKNAIYLIDMNEYKIIQKIDVINNKVSKIFSICPICKINNFNFISGDNDGNVHFFLWENNKFILKDSKNILEEEKKRIYDEITSLDPNYNNREFLLSSQQYIFKYIILLQNGDILTLYDKIKIYKGKYECMNK